MQMLVVLLVVALILGGIYLMMADQWHQDRMQELEIQRAIAREETRRAEAFYATLANMGGSLVLGLAVVAIVVTGGIVIASRQPKEVTYNNVTYMLVPPPEMRRMEMWKAVAQLGPGRVDYLQADRKQEVEIYEG